MAWHSSGEQFWLLTFQKGKKKFELSILEIILISIINKLNDLLN